MAEPTAHPHVHGSDGHHDHPHGAPDHVDRRTFLRWGAGLGAVLLASCTTNGSTDGSDGSSGSAGSASPSTSAAGPVSPTTATAVTTATTAAPTTATTPTTPTTLVDTLAGFAPFADTVRVVASGDVWLVESTGMPAHQLMVGITSWQQQVPLPQPYRGGNAWQIPRRPALAETPISARTALYRGAIALAVNGVPIFNALNNRGEDALLAGELDTWGGHAGRADDYHYHVAPWHLVDVVGPRTPFAYALDGFPIFGDVEPDGSPLRPLDDLNGHDDGAGGYHYHGTRTFPYINGGLRGEVQVQDDQVTPQPVARPVRPATSPLRGATITDFASTGTDAWRLSYTIGGGVAEVRYRIDASTVVFEFRDPAGAVRTETYTRR